MKKINPMDPNLIMAWNKGRTAGMKEANEDFQNFLEESWNKGWEKGYEKSNDVFATMISEKLGSLTDIPGIGEVTAWKIREHFIEEFRGNEDES